MNTRLPFPDRTEAGNVLAEALQDHSRAKDTLVLGLVRGGVVVGRALADKLHLPLFPYIVRKIGHPENREYGLGAIAEGGETFLDEALMNAYGISWEDIEPIIEEEMRELKRRKETYQTHPRPNLQGKTIILTDDGSATGATMLAAIADMRKAKAKKVIVALPVCPPDTAQILKRKADNSVILATPEPFNAVGQWYVYFHAVEDHEVLQLLQKPRRAPEPSSRKGQKMLK